MGRQAREEGWTVDRLALVAAGPVVRFGSQGKVSSARDGQAGVVIRTGFWTRLVALGLLPTRRLRAGSRRAPTLLMPPLPLWNQNLPPVQDGRSRRADHTFPTNQHSPHFTWTHTPQPPTPTRPTQPSTLSPHSTPCTRLLSLLHSTLPPSSLLPRFDVVPSPLARDRGARPCTGPFRTS